MSKFWIFVGLLAFIGIGHCVAETCKSGFTCNTSSAKSELISTVNCTSHFGAFPELETKAQKLAIQHLKASMELLLLSTRFSYWKTQRNGFRKLFDTLSDDAFNDAVHIIQHMGKRGGKLRKFLIEMPMPETDYQVSEIEAMGMALDFQVTLAQETLSVMHAMSQGTLAKERTMDTIYSMTNQKPRTPDGEFAHFLAEEIAEKHANRIHSLAGHVNNLGDAIAANGANRALVIYIYDTQILP